MAGGWRIWQDGCNANRQTTEKEDRKVVKEEVDQSRKEMTGGGAVDGL